MEDMLLRGAESFRCIVVYFIYTTNATVGEDYKHRDEPLKIKIFYYLLKHSFSLIGFIYNLLVTSIY